MLSFFPTDSCPMLSFFPTDSCPMLSFFPTDSCPINSIVLISLFSVAFLLTAVLSVFFDALIAFSSAITGSTFFLISSFSFSVKIFLTFVSASGSSFMVSDSSASVIFSLSLNLLTMLSRIAACDESSSAEAAHSSLVAEFV